MPRGSLGALPCRAACYIEGMLRSFAFGVCWVAVFAAGCGGASEVPPQAAPGPAETSEAWPAPPPEESAPARPLITREECEASGGAVVGDIGDGAIHRAEYRCPSGAEPSGNIKAPEGGPVPVEGAVCCPE